jgi:tRNA pseudouridine55 synthase
MDGIIVVDKPRGMTSFAVIARLRRLLGVKKMGHAGTLDPDASGVLPVCLGRATKVIEYLMDKDKAYHAVLRLGIETDTQDASGKVLAVNPVRASDEEIAEAVQSFVGDIMQVPPMYSAVRIGGKRLYEIARQGRDIERQARPVTIKSIEGIRVERTEEAVRVAFDVECSKGTYIRTLCADMGAALGCGGHMESLVRTRSGPFLLEDAHSLEELESRVKDSTIEGAVLKADEALKGLPACSVGPGERERLKNGLAVGFESDCAKPGDLVRLYEGSNLIAIGRVLEHGGKAVIKSHKWLGGI